jgi:hypothetical protein
LNGRGEKSINVNVDIIVGVCEHRIIAVDNRIVAAPRFVEAQSRRCIVELIKGAGENLRR